MPSSAGTVKVPQAPGGALTQDASVPIDSSLRPGRRALAVRPPPHHSRHSRPGGHGQAQHGARPGPGRCRMHPVVTGSLPHRPGRRPDQPVAGAARGAAGAAGTSMAAGHTRTAARWSADAWSGGFRSWRVPLIRAQDAHGRGVRSGSVPRDVSRVPPASRSGSIRASGRIGCPEAPALPEARILPGHEPQVNDRARCAAGGGWVRRGNRVMAATTSTDACGCGSAVAGDPARVPAGQGPALSDGLGAHVASHGTSGGRVAADQSRQSYRWRQRPVSRRFSWTATTRRARDRVSRR
jgi:hypothetical protein